MKKLTLLFIGSAAIFLVSCKKDYTCTCTTTGGGTNITKVIGVSKKTAKANCVSTIENGYNTECTLSK